MIESVVHAVKKLHLNWKLWLKSVIIVTQCLAGLRTVFCALSETVLAIEMKLKQKRFF